METTLDVFTGESHDLLVMLSRFEVQGHDGLTGRYKDLAASAQSHTSTTIFTVINSSLRRDGHTSIFEDDTNMQVMILKESAIEIVLRAVQKGRCTGRNPSNSRKSNVYVVIVFTRSSEQNQNGFC